MRSLGCRDTRSHHLDAEAGIEELSDSLREQLLSGWSGRAVAYPADRTVLQLFQECAAARPDRVAVVYGHDSLTYGELDQRSNTLAHELHERGVRRGEFLPLALESGLELPLAMIASMKIAAPFVPIDPAGPVERTTLMIETMGARVLVDAPGSSTGPESVTRISLDATRTPGTPAAPAVPPATLDDPIYGFYTSGSTGEPKCAVNIHRGLLNRFSYMTRALSSRSDEVVLQNSRPQFDSSLWQLLWPLTTGSMVVMPTRSGILDLPSTIDTIERYGVTMTDFVPSIFNTLVELLHAEPELVGRLRSLRRLLIGGEEMTAATVHAFRAMLPTVDTINTYGPTEASIGSVFHHVTEADGEVIPLGRPIDNTYLLILDSGLTLVRPGEIGELYIGGDCLGLGYLNDPERTKAAFVDNPFPEIPGNRLYRTGDLGFHSANGLVHFAGRRDNQVKIAGVRIELLDVEAAFLRLDDVTDAKVVASSDLDNRMLIAFVTTRATGTDASVLMAQVRDMLPATMLPRRIVILDQMPLTPNGKADRRALVALADSLTSQTVMAVPTDAADVVRAHWLELLPVAQLDPDDDFFESGGDSLTAQRLAIALEQRFNGRSRPGHLRVADVARPDRPADRGREASHDVGHLGRRATGYRPAPGHPHGRRGGTGAPGRRLPHGSDRLRRSATAVRPSRSDLGDGILPGPRLGRALGARSDRRQPPALPALAARVERADQGGPGRPRPPRPRSRSRGVR